VIAAQLVRVRARLAGKWALEQQLSTLQAHCDADHARHDCGILHGLVASEHGEACACQPAPQR
jgi:hypothetical protein